MKRSPLLVWTLAFLLCPSTRAADPPAPTDSADSLLGRWRGSAVLTNSASAPCRYEAKGPEPGVVLEVRRKAEVWSVTLVLALPATTDCPAIGETLEASDVQVSGRRLAFVAPEGHTWTLAKRQDRIQGIVSAAGGKGNLRLDGEVDLAYEPPPSAGAGPAKRGGVSAKAVGAFLGVNVVAAGALIGVNQLGKTTPGSGKATCSPRSCILPASGACICTTQNTTGAPCGSTTEGVAYLGICNPDAGQPCESTLTCAGGICDVSDGGRCPL